MIEWLFEAVIGKSFEALRATGLPVWAAVAIVVLVIGGLLGAAVYFAWGW